MKLTSYQKMHAASLEPKDKIPFQVLTPPSRSPVAGWLYSILGWLIIWAGPLGVPIVRRGRRLRAPDALNKLRKDKRPPALYLRSFGDDQLPDPSARPYQLSIASYEDRVTQALNRIGPPIAIGKPGEETLQTGAARIYVQDDDWQRAVIYFMRRSAVVVVVVGKSPGIWWEIEQALRDVKPERLLIFLPYVDEEAERKPSFWKRFYLSMRQQTTTRRTRPRLEAGRQERYRIFRERAKSILPCRLPDSIGRSQFIAFDANWSPWLLRTKRSYFLQIAMIELWESTSIDFQKTLHPFIKRYEDSLYRGK
jgi:hypothetical protein